MDLYETLNKCPKSKFDSKHKIGTLNDLTSDKCNFIEDVKESSKHLDYTTKNFYDKKIVQNRGIFFNENFGVPLCKIDTSSNTRVGELSPLKNDTCKKLTKYESDTNKTLKYYTQNFFDKKIIQNRGVFFNDGVGIPSCKIDRSSNARLGSLTNINLIQNLPALPLPTTASFSKGQGPVDVEDYIRPLHNRKLKQCNPKDTQFYNRHFSIFDYVPIKPNECVDNYVQKSPSYRQGIPTRHALNTNYRSGKNCKW